MINDKFVHENRAKTRARGSKYQALIDGGE